MEIVE